MKLRSLAAAGIWLFGLLPTKAAQACGVSASGVASCSLAEHEEETRPKWAVGLSGLYTSTRLRFSESISGPETRYASLASLAYLPSKKLLLQAGLGATFGGRLSVGQDSYRFLPGPVALVGADYRVFDEGRWFVLVTSGLSVSANRTQLGDAPSVGYEATDLRLGSEVGVRLAQVFRPYAAARVFGGPVFWRYQGRAVTGTDTHHYQLGAGLALALPGNINASLEGIPLGERAASIALGAAF